jgi:hypothetical protein
MAISNTSILIKRSTTTATPSSLKAGEIAYSYSSNNFFIGTPDGTGTLPLGGYTTYTAVNNATNANTGSTIVKRAADGSFAGQLFGNANTATALQTARNFSISGGDIAASAQSFDGTGAVTLNASLNAVSGLTGGVYGSSTAVPVLGIAANGRIMNVTTQTITTSFNISDGTTSNTINGGATFFNKGTNGITTTVSANTVTISTDTTIARTNTTGVGAQVFQTDVNLPTNNMSVGGTLTVSNLAVSGNITFANSISTLNITDPMIYLASNNSGNLVDIGMVGHFVGTGHSGDTSHYQHTGFVRDYNDNKWKLFSNVSIEPTTTVTFDANTFYDVIKVGGVDTSGGNLSNVATGNITSATIGTLYLTNALGVAQGGTGATSFTGNQITFYNGTSLASLANTGTAGTYGAASYVPIITTDGYGRVSGVSNTQIAIDASQITSGTLGYSRGGTGSTSYTTGALLVAGATGLLSLANTTFTATGTGAANSTVTSLTVDAYGRFTAATYSAIAGLTVGQGGTGATTFTSSGVIYGNGTGAMQVTALAGSGSDQTWSNQILTVNNSGTPVWSSAMDGGTF